MALNRKHRRATGAKARHAPAMRPAAIRDDPDGIATLCNALLASGRTGEAAMRLARAVDIHPRHAALRNNLGNALASLGRAAEALPHFIAALRLRPDVPEIHNNLGNAFAALGRHKEAVSSFRAGLALRPDLAALHNNLGSALKSLGDHAGAEASFRAALALAPRQPSISFNLAALLIARDRPAEAAALLGEILKIKPNHVETLNNLGVALKNLGQFDAAEARFKRALALAPEHADTHNNLGTLWHARGVLGKARACYKRALALRPDMARTWCNLGTTEAAFGDLDAARAALRRAIAIDPLVAGYHRNLVDLTRLSEGDADHQALRQLAAQLDTLPDADRIDAHFALAKSYVDCNRPAEAMAHYRAGNALKRAQIVYDEAATLQELAAIPARFPARWVRAGGGDPAALPIFIVGMPRSGTTLVEQILASLPGVHGGEEMDAFERVLEQFPPPETLDAAGLHALGEAYLARLRALAPGATRVTNKVPLNFRHLGLIHRVLPGARIVHLIRDPLDTCFSCFTKLFTGALDFTYDLGELGRYYRAYERVMAHWREALPAGIMLDLRYEALVRDFVPEAQRLIAHCGLQWDAKCQGFHLTDRTVRTASLAQVRSPLFTSSIGRSAAFAAALAPLRAALGEGNPGAKPLDPVLNG